MLLAHVGEPRQTDGDDGVGEVFVVADEAPEGEGGEVEGEVGGVAGGVRGAGAGGGGGERQLDVEVVVVEEADADGFDGGCERGRDGGGGDGDGVAVDEGCLCGACFFRGGAGQAAGVAADVIVGGAVAGAASSAGQGLRSLDSWYPPLLSGRWSSLRLTYHLGVFVPEDERQLVAVAGTYLARSPALGAGRFEEVALCVAQLVSAIAPSWSCQTVCPHDRVLVAC